MKFFCKCIAVLVISLIFGIGTAILGLKWGAESASVNNGAWYINPLVGSQSADMYTRAIVAITGLFALDKSEAVYYTALTDDEGDDLSTDCVYRLEGKDIDARWWSFTIYGDDQFLVPNKENRYSYNLENLIRETDNRYKVYLSRQRKNGNWLPVGDRGNFSITLRMYNPTKSVYENPSKIELPKITKEECK